MLQTKKYIKIVLVIALSFGINSCALFGGKNKCGDCPSWSKGNVQINKGDVRV